MKKYCKIRGATMTEYVLIIGLITVSALLALTSLGANIATFLMDIATLISSFGTN